jgi:hypothetical protein
VNAPVEQAAAPSTANVRKALFAAQRDVEAVAKGDTATVRGEKDGKGYSYTYKFTSSEDMLAHCREVLHRHGLTWEMVGYDVAAPMLGLKSPTLWGEFELCHAESGEVLSRRYPMPIAGRNEDDKKIAGACTYLLGHATRLLLLVPKVSEEDAAQNPDRRVDESHPRSERRVIPAHAPAQPMGPVPRHYSDAELKRLRHDCQRLVDLAKPLLDRKATELRTDAGLPAEATLSGQQLAGYRKWLIESIDVRGGVVPEWARDWDPLDQRVPGETFEP